MSKRQIRLTDGELVKLMEESVESGQHIQLAFGVGGAALTWTEGEPMPWAVERVGYYRGILNENMHGAGI